MTPAPGTDPILALGSVSRSFGGVRALDGVSLDVRAGEVHCLAGENGSGKSTLIKIVAGVLRPTSGAIQIAGRTLPHLTPIEAVRVGIQVIYQDLSLFPNLTVAENLALNTLLQQRTWLVRPRAVREIASRAMKNLGVDLALDRPLGTLTMAERQLVAVARALVQDARLVILDEPTTALTAVEVAALFAVVRRLTAQGVAVVFVSHKIREMLQISDRFTILRNGRVVESGPAAEYSESKIARAMTGRVVGGDRPRRPRPDGPPRLRVRRLSAARFREVGFDVRAGEVVGLTGLLGAGQSEVALALAGVAPPIAGDVEVDGIARSIRSVRDAMRAGIAYVPDDRLAQGLFREQSITRNINASSLRRARRGAALLSSRSLTSEAVHWAERLNLRYASLEAPARTLSGGNQQRVVLAKALATGPKVLILNGPTVGVDVGSKEAIHATIRGLAGEGMAVVMVSDDVNELVENCDRVLIARGGTIDEELSDERLTEDELSARLMIRH